jgi:two-component system, OmpR family, heavy metal sensor histidine kinase CusS
MNQSDKAGCQVPLVRSHSISGRLSKKLALLTIVVFGLLSWASWSGVHMMMVERTQQDVQSRADALQALITLEAHSGGYAAVQQRLQRDQPMRSASRLEVWRADGSVLHADPASTAFLASKHLNHRDFTVAAPDLPGGTLRGRYTVDCAADSALGTRWALILLTVTLAAGALVGGATWWHVKRGLAPLRQLAAQTRSISPQNLEQRLALKDPAEELKPWVDQFNALMQRLEQSYAQLEGFNADVAHELRTPLATLVGETELALSRERSNESLRETLISNLEEMQRLSAMVNDMLFLSHADRGAVARRGQPVSLAMLAQQVAEFHEATLEESGVGLRVDGDAVVAVDEPLFKRAVSNLLGNAIRFAERGSVVVLRIAPELPEQVQVVVQNQGRAIASEQLPRLFDRFFRGEESRACPESKHHGLGLAIVAAIARMHAGRTLAESDAGLTRVGFTLAAR